LVEDGTQQTVSRGESAWEEEAAIRPELFGIPAATPCCVNPIRAKENLGEVL